MYNGFFTQQSCKNTPSRIISHSTYSRIVEWIRSLWRRCAKLLFPNDNNLPDVAYEEIIMPQYFDSKSIETTAGNYLSTQYLHDRFGLSRRDIDSVLPITSNIFKFKDVDLQLTDEVSQEPRWPTVCKVIQERVSHIDYIPAQPEPYYVSTGREPKPKPVGDEFGTVIFNYSPISATNYFSRSCSGGTTVLSSSNSTPSYLGDLSEDNFNNSASKNRNDLEFESRFESGNLEKVLKITDSYYQLHLRRDMYTQRHMQWFYFRISNTRSRIIYRLSIVNFCKEDSLYNDGLRPLLYSTKDATMHAVGWRRCGDNISYYKNDPSDEEREKHTLTFNITFPHDHDIVYLAHCYPYTYTDLQEYLSTISNDPVKSRFTKLRLLCRTLAGNNVHYLTITAPNCNEDGRKKKGIVITARVHPGETPSSWMMKGIIDFLIGESNQARELRERFIFKLVPMLNPDGVIVGNNRCSLSGKDLNRQYRTVMRESYPSVWHTKLMIRRLMEECGIAMYCDLHAHSRKHNVFIYGCESKRANCYGKLTEQIFPLMLHKNAADKFSFENCKFHIEKGKEGTSRVVVWLMGIQNSYTMEASMGGSTLGSRNGTHFSIQDYEQIGKAFCETLLDFSDDDPTKEKLRNKILVRLIKEGSSADEPTNINLTDYSSDEGDTSDSSSDDKLKLDQVNCINSDSSDEDAVLQPCFCVPPPSPQLNKSRMINKLKKIRRKTTTMGEKNHRVKRKLLAVQKIENRRMVMDLPATDPGSDMYCEFTEDSTDENNPRTSEQFIKNRRSCGASRDTCTPLANAEEVKKKFDTENLPLLSSQTLAFNNETIVERVSSAKLPTRVRPVQPPRYMKYLSPVVPRTPDIHMKLTTRKQQIWTGMAMYENSHLDVENTVEKDFLGSDAANVIFYEQNSDALLRSCSKKLMALDYAEKFEDRVSKKVEKSNKKLEKISNDDSNNEKQFDDVKKCVRKKRHNLRRHRTVININSNISSTLLNADCNNTELKTLQGPQDDSLKLFGIAKLPKTQSNINNKSKNNESRRKFRKGGFVANATVHVAKIKSKLLFNDNIINESCSSDDVITTTTTTLSTTRLRPSKSRKRK